MKAFVCFALFAVAAAIPLQEAQVVVIPDVPIPVEMLRSGSFMPVWRDLPQVEDIPVPVPERNMRDFPNFEISEVRFIDDLPEGIQAVYAEVPADVADEEIVPEAVKVVDPFTNEAELSVPSENVADAEEIVPEAVNVVEYLEPANVDVLAPELPASEDAEMRFVKFVDSPATFDMKNMKVPIDAHDIV